MRTKIDINKLILNPLNLFIIPGMIYLIINNYIPMVGVLIAFKQVDYSVGIFWSEWIGLENFKFLFASRDAFIITRNTLLYNLAFIGLGTFLGLVSGIFLSEIASKACQKVYQTIILFPQLFSIIIVAYIVVGFLSTDAGFINNSVFGPERTVNFYTESVYWPFLLTFIHLWRGLGYNSIIYLSAIVSVDKNLYESATIDGANRLQQVFNVTIPTIKPTITTLILIGVGRIFYTDFGLFYQVPMNSGRLFNVTNTIDTYTFRGLMQFNNIALSSAAGTYQAIVGLIIILTVNGLVRKFDRDNAMF